MVRIGSEEPAAGSVGAAAEPAQGRGSIIGEADNKGGVDDTGARVLHPSFLKAEIGHRTLEGGIHHEREVGGGVTEVLVDTHSKSGEENCIVDLKSMSLSSS